MLSRIRAGLSVNRMYCWQNWEQTANRKRDFCAKNTQPTFQSRSTRPSPYPLNINRLASGINGRRLEACGALTGALHDDDHQGDGGAKHPAQHGGGSDERVHSRLDVPGGQPLHKARAHQPPEGGAQHDGGHEQAAGHRRAARQRHQNHVREGVNREGLAAKVLLVLAVRLLPGAQKQLDGVLGEGEEERGQLVVLACRTGETGRGGNRSRNSFSFVMPPAL